MSVRRGGAEVATLGPGSVVGEARDRQPLPAVGHRRRADAAEGRPLHRATRSRTSSSRCRPSATALAPPRRGASREADRVGEADAGRTADRAARHRRDARARSCSARQPSLTRVEVAERAGVPLELAQELWRLLGFPHQPTTPSPSPRPTSRPCGVSHDLVQLGILGAGPAGRAGAHLGAQLRPAGRVADQAARRRRRRAATRTRQRGLRPRRRGAAAGRGAADLRLAPAPRQRASRLLDDAERRDRHRVAAVGLLRRHRRLHLAQQGARRAPSSCSGSSASSRRPPALVVDHGGRVIKTIGDEVLFTVADPAAAVAVALELTARGSRRGRPLPGGAGRHRLRRRRPPPRRRLRPDGQRRLPPDLGRPAGQRAGRRGRPRRARPHDTAARASARTTARRRGVSAAPAGSRPRGSPTSRPGASGSLGGLRKGVAEGVAGASEDTEPPGYRFRRLRRVSVKGYPRLEAWRVKRPPSD